MHPHQPSAAAAGGGARVKAEQHAAPHAATKRQQPQPRGGVGQGGAGHPLGSAGGAAFSPPHPPFAAVARPCRGRPPPPWPPPTLQQRGQRADAGAGPRARGRLGTPPAGRFCPRITGRERSSPCRRRRVHVPCRPGSRQHLARRALLQSSTPRPHLAYPTHSHCRPPRRVAPSTPRRRRLPHRPAVVRRRVAVRRRQRRCARCLEERIRRRHTPRPIFRDAAPTALSAPPPPPPSNPAACLDQTARLYVCTSARPWWHGYTARPHSGSARLYDCTAARPCGHTARTAGARPTRRSPLESSPRRRQRPAAVHTPPLPPDRYAGRAQAQRPPARTPQSGVGGGSPHTPPLPPARSAWSASTVRGGGAERRGEDGAASTDRADRGATGARCSDGSGLGEETKLPCAFDYKLHPPAYPCKGDRHSINAMYH